MPKPIADRCAVCNLTRAELEIGEAETKSVLVQYKVEHEGSELGKIFLCKWCGPALLQLLKEESCT